MTNCATTTYSCYRVGNTAGLTGTFTDSNTHAVYDPPKVRVHVVSPDAPEGVDYVYGTDANLVKLSVGVYQLALELPTAGRYTWEFLGEDDTYLGPRDVGTITATL